ncbi:MAG: segregation and condensation protein A [Acutalibacteraceae bacterium]
MEKLSYKLDIFEGPLDLLLHLIIKHKLDISDIPILELVEQYLSYVEKMRKINLEVASEFLEMAARLVYIKTVSLLPVHEEGQELKKELTAELIGYRDCKLLAAELACRTDGFGYIERTPEAIQTDLTYTRLHETSQLLQAYSTVAGRKLRRMPPPLESFRSIVSRKIVSVTSKIEYIVKTLKKGKRKRLISILEDSKSRSDLIATFLAILELAKSKTIYVSGSGEEASILLLENKEMEIS